jgi:hypothetical protein
MMLQKFPALGLLALAIASTAAAQEPAYWIESRNDRIPPDFVVFDAAEKVSAVRPVPDMRFIVFPRGADGKPAAVASAILTRTYDCISKTVSAPSYSAYTADGALVSGDRPPPQDVLDKAPIEKWQISQWERDCRAEPLQKVQMAPAPKIQIVDKPSGNKPMKTLAEATTYAAKKQDLVAIARATPVTGDFVRLDTPLASQGATGSGWRQYALDLAATKPVGEQLRVSFVRVREYYDGTQTMERAIYLVDCSAKTAERETLFEYRRDGNLRWVEGAAPRAGFEHQTAADFLPQACTINRKARVPHFPSMGPALGLSPQDTAKPD